MQKDKTKSGVPEKVAQMIAIATQQRRMYAGHPDPLQISEPEAVEDVLELSPEEILEECSEQPETDIGNANRLLIRFGERLRHVTHVGWHGYDGKRWLEDASGSVVRRFAHRTAEHIDDEAVRLDCSEDEQAKIAAGRIAREELKKLGKAEKGWDTDKLAEYERLQKDVEKMERVEKDRSGRISSRHGHAKSAAGTSKINNMLQEAAPYCSLQVSDLNKELLALNCETGTLRFFCSEVDGASEWKIRLDPHRPADLISKLCDVDFKANAEAPLFMEFLQRVMPNPDYRAFLNRYLGYCLLGLTGEQCLLFFYGAGRNGKSTFVDIMVEILNDYAVSMSIDSFAGDSKRGGAEATPDLARLPGARLVAASEPEMGVHLKDALIKTLTGGEPIAVRRLHQDFFELIPQFKIILSGNHKPIIKDDSDGIWRRVHLVPWEIQIPEEEVDKTLKEKLLATERQGIFIWMVRGALEYLQLGLRVPEGVRAATAEYREESDPIGAFLRNACHITGLEGDRENPEDLYNGYVRYAKKEGLADIRQATFSRRLPDQTRKMWKSPDGKMCQFVRMRSNGTFYSGIRIRDEFAGKPDVGSPPEGRFDDKEPFPEEF
ncbi:DNA primase family protein [Agrobacterium rosae]|uniref:DNA primase family protein n=1 Tax=Agrobacterium rosae TaxID=1972867 RepID=UPI003BA2727A